MPKKKIAVAAALRTARKKLRMTMRELARLTGFSDKTISVWELGNAVPSRGSALLLVDRVATHDAQVAAELARALGVRTPAAPDPPRAADPRDAFDAAVYLAADALNVPARALRGALAHVLVQARASAMTLDDACESLRRGVLRRDHRGGAAPIR